MLLPNNLKNQQQQRPNPKAFPHFQFLLIFSHMQAKKSLINATKLPESKLVLCILLNNSHLEWAGGETEAEQERRQLFWERKW